MTRDHAELANRLAVTEEDIRDRDPIDLLKLLRVDVCGGPARKPRGSRRCRDPHSEPSHRGKCHSEARCERGDLNPHALSGTSS
jgi:hypothetical protein